MKNKKRMKNFFPLLGWAVVTCGVFSGLAGCSRAEVDDVPLTKEAKLKAIENNPDFKPEQKAAFKQQVEENERMNAMLEKRGRELDPGTPKPMPSR